MLKVLAVLVVLGAAGFGVYVYWDGIVPRSTQGPSLRGMETRLLGKRVPGFALPGVVGEGFEARDLLGARRPVLVKFWGSWCPTCIQEYPVLLELQSSNIPTLAIVFRDTRGNALDYLERNGNPFTRVALDTAGRVAADWGVTEVPATFLVDGEGIVRWHFSGPLTALVLARQIRPLIERYSN